MRPRLLALLALPLLGWECGPVSPEQDTLLATSPEAVARLRAEHGAIIAVVEDWSEDDTEVVSIPADSPYLSTLAQGAEGIRHARGLRGAHWVMNGRSDSECREADDCTSFLFAIDYKRPLRKPTWVEVHFDLGMSNDDDQGPKVTWVTSPQAALIRYDQAAVMAGTQAYIDRIFADLAAYEADFDTERMAVLAALVGCPDDTNPDYDSESCWCVDQEGQRHGPYVEGDEYLAVVSGVRRVEGAYVHGQQHGTWIYRDQDGNEIRRELWKAGTQVGTKAPEDPNPHPMSRPPPDAGP